MELLDWALWLSTLLRTTPYAKDTTLCSSPNLLLTAGAQRCIMYSTEQNAVSRV